MKKILLGLALLFFIFPQSASAHLAGQPPFFKINGIFSNLYPVPTSSVADYNLPQDLADKNYLVGDTLNFEMDTSQLPILPEIVDKTEFDWDMGDGTHGTGLKNTHVYNKPGSYILTITATYGTDQPQLIQSVMINILPDKNYQLPVAKIVVNGKESKDPLTDVLHINMKKSVQFDSSKSTAKGKIVSYFWDFGDGQSGSEANPQHSYDVDATQVFPVLRVKDDQGFIADSYVELNQDDKEQPGAGSNTSDSPVNIGGSLNWTYVGIGALIVAALGAFWFFRSQVKR